jgi:hypothetical protein
MPIPPGVAVGWFVGTLIESVVGGLLAGLIVKGPEAVGPST